MARKIELSRKIDISHKTIFFITGFLALFWALFLIRDVIILLFIAIIFMSALAPIVERLQLMKIPKVLAIALVYITIIGSIVGLVTLVVTPLAEETNSLAQTLPHTLQQAFPSALIDRNVIQQELTSLSRNAFSFTLTIFGQFLGVISVAVLTFYLLLERDKLDQLVAQFFIGREDKVIKITRKIEEKLGSWLRGQIALSLIIGTASYIALRLIDVPYALPLAILAGLLEVVPVIGPIISSLPSILIAYVTLSPVHALFTAGAFFIIQQLENHIVVPQVMKKAVGLNPLIVILAVSIGGKLLGVSGALLAVPIAVVIQIITQEILRENHTEIIP